MPRVASLWFPTLSTDRVRRSRRASSPDGPLVTALAEHGRRVVVACSGEARGLGLRPGMPLAEARVLVADLVVAEADTQGDAALLASLADHAARRWTPLAAVDGDGLLLDITASAHLFGGEAALARMIAAVVRRAGLAVRIGIADSVGAAHALARYGGGGFMIAPQGGNAAAIAPLPPAALRLDREVAAAIHRLGFATIADLLAVPRAPLIRRLGADLGRRIEQALGRRGEPIEALVPQDAPAVRRSLIEPISTAEAIAMVMQDLAADLCAQLEQSRLGARRLLLLCRRVDARDETVAAGLSRPSRDAAHIAELLRRRIETIDPGFGIEAMTLVAPRTGPLAAAQLAMSPATPERAAGTVVALPYPGSPVRPDPAGPPDLAALIDRLANRFGDARLHRAALVESDTPERTVARISPLAPATGRAWRPDWPRPSRLLRCPERIDNTIADMPDYAPAAFSWRGTRYRVVAADGPERVCGEWWRGGADPYRVRDYFQVEVTGGARYWLFRMGDGVHPAAGPGDWYLHGAFA